MSTNKSGKRGLPFNLGQKPSTTAREFAEIEQFLDEIRRYSPLSAEEERELLSEIVKTGNEEAKQKIVLHNIHLVIWISKHYRGRGLDLQDLIQEGSLGLIEAIEKFELGRGTRFSSCAVWWILSSITRAISNLGSFVRIPVQKRQMVVKFKKLVKGLAEDGRLPTQEEVATCFSDKSPKAVKQLMRLAHSSVVSLDKVVENRKEDGNGRTTASFTNHNTLSPLSKLTATEELGAARRAVAKTLGYLEILPISDRNKTIFRLYSLGVNGHARTMKSVGEEFGMTRESVRQICEKTWDKLNMMGNGHDKESFQEELRCIEELRNIIGDEDEPLPIEPKRFSRGEKKQLLERLPRSLVKKPARPKASNKGVPSGEAVLQAVADAYGLRETDLLEKNKKRNVSYPRQIAVYLLRHDLKWRFVRIGQNLQRNHKTVIESCRRIERRVKTDKRVREDIKTIRSRYPRSKSNGQSTKRKE